MDADERNGYELILNPAYSSTPASSVYFLFPKMINDICGRHFLSHEEVMRKDHDFVSSGFTVDLCTSDSVAITSINKRWISSGNKLGW